MKYKKKNIQSELYTKIISQKELVPESVNFFDDFVSRLKISFQEPESRIIKQNDTR